MSDRIIAEFHGHYYDQMTDTKPNQFRDFAYVKRQVLSELIESRSRASKQINIIIPNVTHITTDHGMMTVAISPEAVIDGLHLCAEFIKPHENIKVNLHRVFTHKDNTLNTTFVDKVLDAFTRVQLVGFVTAALPDYIFFALRVNSNNDIYVEFTHV